MTADLPEKARVRWDAILQEAEKKKTGLSDELRRQLPKLVEETAEEAAKVRYKPYLYSELFWYHLQRRAWFIICKSTARAGPLLYAKPTVQMATVNSRGLRFTRGGSGATPISVLSSTPSLAATNIWMHSLAFVHVCWAPRDRRGVRK